MIPVASPIDGSPFGAFAVLQDGRWHSKAELVQKCGREALRRVRALRNARYGGWNVELAKGRHASDKFIAAGTLDSWYRIAKSDIEEGALVAAKLRSRVTPFPQDAEHDVDKPLNIALTVAEGVLILAHMVGSQQLQHPDVQCLWQQTRAEVLYKLQEALPPDIINPFDLMECDTQDAQR